MAEHGALPDVVTAITNNARYKLPEGFVGAANRAVIMFKHALVFDPEHNSVSHCRNLPPDAPKLIVIGSPNWMGRIPTSRSEAIGLARGDINPDTLETYPTHFHTTTINAPVHESRRRRHDRAWEFPSYQWKELLLQHGIKFDVPQRTKIPQELLVKVLALTEEDVKQGAGLFSEYTRDEHETYAHFKRLCADAQHIWDIKALQAWCKTRRLGYSKMCRKRSVQLSVEELLGRIDKQLNLEVIKGRWTHIVCPLRTQLPLRQRRIKLQAVGILNVYNYRRLVEVTRPDESDPRWGFVQKEHLADMEFPRIAHDWFANFAKNWKTMWKKGEKLFWEGVIIRGRRGVIAELFALKRGSQNLWWLDELMILMNCFFFAQISARFVQPGFHVPKWVCTQMVVRVEGVGVFDSLHFASRLAVSVEVACKSLHRTTSRNPLAIHNCCPPVNKVLIPD